MIELKSPTGNDYVFA